MQSLRPVRRVAELGSLGELMRAIFILATICFAVLGCSRSGPDVRLAGRWTLDETDSQGTGFRSSTVIDDEGHYECKYTVSTTNGVVDGVIDGVFEQRDEFLIDTMTKHSNTNATLPHTSRARILSHDGNTITLQWDGMTNPVVLRRAKD